MCFLVQATTESVSTLGNFPRGDRGGRGGGTDLQWGSKMGVEEVQKTLEITIKIALWKELQGVKLVQKVRFTCTEPNFDVCVVLREAGVKRDMCKKHGKHCEKLVCRHVLTRLVHFDVSSCFYITPKTGQLSNLVPRYANTKPRRPNIEPRKAQRSSKIAPRWIPFLTKI